MKRLLALLACAALALPALGARIEVTSDVSEKGVGKPTQGGMVYWDNLPPTGVTYLSGQFQRVLQAADKEANQGGDFSVRYVVTITGDDGKVDRQEYVKAGITRKGGDKINRMIEHVGQDLAKRSEEHAAKGGKHPAHMKD